MVASIDAVQSLRTSRVPTTRALGKCIVDLRSDAGKLANTLQPVRVSGSDPMETREDWSHTAEVLTGWREPVISGESMADLVALVDLISGGTC